MLQYCRLDCYFWACCRLVGLEWHDVSYIMMPIWKKQYCNGQQYWVHCLLATLPAANDYSTAAAAGMLTQTSMAFGLEVARTLTRFMAAVNFNERLYFHIIPSHWLDGSFGMFHLPMWFNHKPQCGSQSMSSLSMLVILLLNQSYTAPVMAWISKHIRWDKSLNFNCSRCNYCRWILPLTRHDSHSIHQIIQSKQLMDMTFFMGSNMQQSVKTDIVFITER